MRASILACVHVSFSDEPYVYALRKRLWTPGPNGRAAVMVGAGYSRNAVPRSPSSPPFPLWTAMAEALYDGLYPGPPEVDRDHKVALAAAGGGMLRLAQEYQATFGRGALDDLVRRTVPDADHDPGDLHVDLLDLPWADVFTTNYDTLLERSRRRIASRRYDLVLTRDDLPYASAPRIVKLHGSFPSHRPFVFTEDDYRRYPRAAAPFVGTVRQALMEHDLVLLGFSGEDPNFLAWLGWVREELRGASPAVYLCGVLDLSPGNRKILEGRGVTPIDLGQLVPSDHPERHATALRWFLDSLANGKPLSGLRWPRTPPPAPGTPPFPPLPHPPGPGSEPRPNEITSLPRPVNQPVPPDDLVSLTEEWAKTRATYPGWIWTPRETRNRLRPRTDPWVDIVPDRAGELDLEPRLRLLDEYVWRLQHIYEPFRPPLADAIRDALDGDAPRAQAQRERLILHLLQEVRAEPPDVFDEVDALVRPLTSPVARATRAYVLALRGLALLDTPAAEQALVEWPTDAGPLWDVRRAGVLLELGRRDDAVALATDVRERAREPRRDPDARPFLAPSIEGAAQQLIDCALNGDDQWRTIEERDRDDELAAIRCDPSTEMQRFENRLSADPPGLPPSQTATPDAFGRERISYAMGRRLDYERYREAFEYLGVHFDIGLPLWFGLRYTPTQRAALWLADLSPEAATDALVRSLDHKELADHLDRPRVARIPEGEVVARTEAALQALARSLPDLRRLPPRAAFAPHKRAAHVAHTAAILLARLSFRLNPEQRMEVALASLAPFRDPLPSFQDYEMRPFEALISEALQLLSPDQVADILPLVAELPLQGEYNLTDPFRSLPLGGVNTLPEQVHESVPMWLQAAENGEAAERTGALSRLQALYANRLLDDDGAREFGRVLWSRRGDDGLPTQTFLRRWVLLALPEPEPGLAQSALRDALLRDLGERATSVVRGLGSSLLDDLSRTAPPTHPAETPAFEVRYIEWSDDDRDTILNGLIALWETTKDDLVDRGGIALARDQTRETLGDLPDVLRRVILPGVPPPDVDEVPRAFEVVRRLRESLQAEGIPTRSMLPALLAADRDRLVISLDAVEIEIRKGLAATDAAAAEDAAKAVCLWTTDSIEGRVPPPLDSLLDELGDVVLTRRPRVLLPVLRWVNRLVRFAPDAVPQSLNSRLCDALAVLLTETDIPSLEERLSARTDADRLQILRRPDTRAVAAELAFRLRPLVGVGSDCATTLAEWETVVETDPFPVVRHVAKRLRDEAEEGEGR